MSERNFESVVASVKGLLSKAKISDDVISDVVRFLGEFSGETVEGLARLSTEDFTSENNVKSWKLPRGISLAIVMDNCRPPKVAKIVREKSNGGVFSGRRQYLSDFMQLPPADLVREFAKMPHQVTAFAFRAMDARAVDRDTKERRQCVIYTEDNSAVDEQATTAKLIAIEDGKLTDTIFEGRRVYFVGERPNERVAIDPIYGDELTDTGKGRFGIKWADVKEEVRRFIRYLIQEDMLSDELTQTEACDAWDGACRGIESLSVRYGGEEVLLAFREALEEGVAPQAFMVRKTVKSSGRKRSRARSLERAASGSRNE